MSSEAWRRVPSQPHIEASTLGRVRLIPKLTPMPHGGFRVCGGKATRGAWDGTRFLYRDNRGRRTLKVARLVCEAFTGPPPDGAVCMHLDENAANNEPTNLRWGTQRENLNAPGFLAYASRVARRKFTGQQIEAGAA